MTKARLIKAWYEARNQEDRDWIAWLFYEHFDEPISLYVH